MIKDYKIKAAFSIEEVVGASLIFAIATAAFGDFSIFGMQLRNILSILIVLILGWKNGILLGATSGVTIGAVIGIVSMQGPVIIAAYALSGMLAGIFSKLGKVGVIIGFIGGTIIFTYITNGNTVQIIYFKEILVASLALLIVPNRVEINLEEFFPKDKCLPTNSRYTLEDNTNTIDRLNSVSETIKEISDTYDNKNQDEEQINKNKEFFIDELQRELEQVEDNFLYDELTEENDKIMSEIFIILTQKEEIEINDLVDIFENNNSYIVGYEAGSEIEVQLEEVVSIINNSYRISKVNFLWTKKVEENKKTVSNQLNGVSKVISAIAEEMKPKENLEFEEIEKRIKMLCKQKKIELLSIEIAKEKNERYSISLYLNACKEETDIPCPVSKIEKILTQVIGENVVLQKEVCAINENTEICKQTYISKDKYKIELGMAKKTKKNEAISGDSSVKVKLEDGKYLLAISDGMGSRPRSKKK